MPHFLFFFFFDLVVSSEVAVTTVGVLTLVMADFRFFCVAVCKSADTSTTTSIGSSLMERTLNPSMYGLTSSSNSFSCCTLVVSRLSRTVTGSKEWNVKP